jgi:hypothetical protein
MLRPLLAIVLVSLSIPVTAKPAAHAAAPAASPTGGIVAKAKAIIADRMVDPNSLVVRKTHVEQASAAGQSVTLLCGEYNAKNRMGGYTGFKTFLYEPAVMKGVLSFEDDLKLDFFSASGSGDVGHDPEAAAQAGVDLVKALADYTKYSDYAEKYLPVCLGAS